MLNVINVVKKYGDFAAVDNVTFELKSGQAALLLGPNGAGKSTLIKCILGLLNYSGEIRIDGLNIKNNKKASKKLISYVPQEPALYDTRTYELVSFYAKLREVDRGKIDKVLEQVDLHQHKDKKTSELSGGMKQRLSLAIALLGDTKLLVLDEPTSNLDSESRTEILSLVKELKNKGYTILFSSHRIDEVRQIADIVISMNKGRISSIEDIDNFNLGNDKSNLQMVLNIENGLLDLAVNILKLEGFDNLKVDNSSIFLQLNKINKNIPIQRLLKNKIIIKDMYVKDKNIN